MTAADVDTHLETIEGINLDAEVPCMGLRYIDPSCPMSNLAELIVGTHTSRNRYPSCRACFDDFTSDPRTTCAATFRVEPGSAHYRIVEVLR